MEDDPKLIKVCPTNRIQILNQHDFFEDFVCILQMILPKISNKYKNIDVGTGAPLQREEVYWW